MQLFIFKLMEVNDDILATEDVNLKLNIILSTFKNVDIFS